MTPRLFADLDKAAQFLEEAASVIIEVHKNYSDLTRDQRYRLDSQLCRLDSTITEIITLALED